MTLVTAEKHIIHRFASHVTQTDRDTHPARCSHCSQRHSAVAITTTPFSNKRLFSASPPRQRQTQTCPACNRASISHRQTRAGAGERCVCVSPHTCTREWSQRNVVKELWTYGKPLIGWLVSETNREALRELQRNNVISNQDHKYRLQNEK